MPVGIQAPSEIQVPDVNPRYLSPNRTVIGPTWQYLALDRGFGPASVGYLLRAARGDTRGALPIPAAFTVLVCWNPAVGAASAISAYST